MSERGFSEIVLSADPRQGRSRRLYRFGEVTAACGDLATVRVDVDDAGNEVCLPDLQVLGPWWVEAGDWVELGYLDDHPNSAYVRSPLFSESRNPALGFRARLTVGDWDAVVDANGGGDYTGIQDALDAGHKSIYVRKGTYDQSGADLTIAGADVVLVGESPAETVIDFGGSAHYLDVQGTALRFAMRGFKVCGSQQSTYGAARLRAQTAKIAGCRFEGNYRHIYAEAGADYWEIVGCILTSAGAGGVGCLGGSDGLFALNRTYDSSECAVTLAGDRALCQGNRGHCIRLEASGAGSRILGNVLDVGRIYATGNRVAIAGNDVRGSVSTASIHATGADTTIQGNTVRDNGSSHGIYVQGSRSMINGNTVYNISGANRDGIYLPTTVSECVAAGNTVNAVSRHGITSLADRTTMSGNNVSGAGANGIHQYGSRCTLSANVCYNNGGYGINIAGADRTFVIGNQCTGNASGQINDAGTNTKPVKAAHFDLTDFNQV